MLWLFAAARAQDEVLVDDVEDVEPEEVEEVVVTGTRTEHTLGDSPIAVEVIDRATIDRSGAVSAADLLERSAGVVVNRSALGASVALQGLDPKHTLILVDGQRMIGQKDGVVDLSRISSERIERIEIVKGPGSTMYGSDAMAGVINIITRNPKATRLTADARYGGFGTFDGTALLEARPGKLGTTTTLGMHRALPYDLDPSNAAQDGVAYDSLEASQKLLLDAGVNTDVIGQASWLTRGTEAIEEQETGAQYLRNNRVEEVQSQLGQSTTIGAGSKLSTNAYLTLFRDQFFYDQVGSNREDLYEDNRQTLGELEVQYTAVIGRHVWSSGVEGFAEWNVSPRLDDGKGTRQRLAVFTQDEWKVVPGKLEVLPGFRFDYDTRFGAAPTPRLAGAWFASDDVVVRASYGAGFRAPDFKEQYLLFENPAAGYVVVGNPELEPERSLGGTLGVEVDPGKVKFTAQAFRNDVSNLIIIDEVEQAEFSATQYFGYSNVARAVTSGVDTNVAVTPIDPLTLRLGGQLLYARDVDSGLPLESRTPISATFGALLAEPRTGLTATVDGTFTGPRTDYALTDDDGGCVEGELVDYDGPVCRSNDDPFVLLDARLAWTWRGGEWFVGGENLLDVGDPVDNQVKPRWVYAGVRIRTGG